MKPEHEFHSDLAHTIFRQKYAQGPNDSWRALAERLVEDVCGTRWGKELPLMSEEEQDFLVKAIREFKFMPGGRYLYYAGRPASYFNNCFRGSETFLTYDGVKSFEEADETEWVLTPNNKFERAIISDFGEQEIHELTFKNVRGKSEKTWTKYATNDHRWILLDGSETTNLQKGDVVPASGYAWSGNDEAFIHGAVFADGNVHPKKNGFGHQLRLCGRKVFYTEKFEDYTITYPQFANGDPVVYVTSDFNMKELPSTKDPDYIASFIEGWATFDGHFGKVNQLHSINEDAIDYFIENAPYAGLVVTGGKLVDDTPSNFGERAPLFRVNFKDADEFPGFKLVSKKFIGKERVYCATVPTTGAFVLSDGMLTGNCYLLRAEYDTREEWSDLMWRAMSCLMTGGGIGVDYSVIRPEGEILSRTGGIASGPIPLMYAINEVGRNVQQGGSRRSAIYASLNWQHEDVPKFLKAKNWHDMDINGTGFTVWDAKQHDFNYKAPLDMTNISLNYDDAWVNLKEPEQHPTFIENCRQALMTGEPGFSFNFGEKENETLRNACTEVTSEDDSDVCNLGSINIGAIDSLEEFKDIVHIASKFLVCGTVRADLPYQKVHDVRHKNRRLGLGLMGMHEWLLKRGYKYEVSDELRQWLQVYKNESENAANEHCDRFYLSRPVAYRSVAPTGSIGILASTTTGIEPIYAVAYKRRYLRDSNKWHYKYVVDSTADELISRYGLDPEFIETALSMAYNPEQRIKFQADVQEYVDMGISSTLNLPAWGTKYNNEDKVEEFARLVATYAPKLRGLTVYPDGARGGQPLSEIPYEKALEHRGVEYQEHSEDQCKSGICGV